MYNHKTKNFRPRLINNNPSLKTGIKLFNKHTAGLLNAHNAHAKVVFLNSFLQYIIKAEKAIRETLSALMENNVPENKVLSTVTRLYSKDFSLEQIKTIMQEKN